MRRLAIALALFLASCGDDEAPQDLTGTYRYTWQVRADGGAYPWDGMFHGELRLQQADLAISASIGYPDEDPAALFGDYRLRDLWTWAATGTYANPITLDAPPPLAAWDDPWTFVLDPHTLQGEAIPVTPSGPRFEGWLFALRQ